MIACGHDRWTLMTAYNQRKTCLHFCKWTGKRNSTALNPSYFMSLKKNPWLTTYNMIDLCPGPRVNICSKILWCKGLPTAWTGVSVSLQLQLKQTRSDRDWEEVYFDVPAHGNSKGSEKSFCNWTKSQSIMEAIKRELVSSLKSVCCFLVKNVSAFIVKQSHVIMYQSNPRMPSPPRPRANPAAFSLTFQKNCYQIPHYVAGWGVTEHQIHHALNMWVVSQAI